MTTILRARKRHYLKRLGIFLIMVTLIAGMVGCIESDPPCRDLEIRDWYDLADVRHNPSGHHRLMNDLNATTAGYEKLAGPTANAGKGWEPIRGRSWPYRVKLFTGTLDGQGYEIRDLFINRPHDAGLFYHVRKGGVIKNVSLVNATITNGSHISGLLAWDSGTASNSYLSPGLEPGPLGCGGLVAWNDGTVTNSSVSGSVSSIYDVGGLVGYNTGTVSDSHFSGSVSGHKSVGGLVGYNRGTVSDSYFSTGSVTGEYVGGLMGLNYHVTPVSNSYYNYDEVLINGENVITIGALFDEDFEEWLANDKFLDVNERLSEQDGYYLIHDVDDFKQLLAFGQDDSLKFRLKNDLDLGDDLNVYVPYLAGEFDGNGHKISNLSFNFDFVSSVGLFGYLAPGGEVTQLGVENGSITGHDSVGGLVGENQGTVTNSYYTGSVTGDKYVGGLVGLNADGATVRECSARGNVTGDWRIGGLVGFNQHGTVSNSYASGSVAGDRGVGGLVASNWGTVDKSYSTADVISHASGGGLIASNDGIVRNSYSTGNVIGTELVGGLVGWNGGDVRNSYSTGSVTGGEYVGGLVGRNSRRGTVSNSYSTGSVTGGEHVGGLVGFNELEEGIVSNSFWDVETSKMEESDGGTDKPTAEMQDIATFTDTETEGLDEPWDITAIAAGERNLAYTWNIVDAETYPFLSWQLVSLV